MHWYSIAGANNDKVGLKESLQVNLNNLGTEASKFLNILEGVFKEHANGPVGKEQLGFLKYDQYFIVIRFADKFTTPSNSREYRREEIHFFSTKEFRSWAQVGDFLALNSLKNINSDEKIEFSYPDTKNINKSFSNDKLLIAIIHCIVAGQTFKAKETGYSLSELLALMDAYPAIGDLVFAVFGISKYNFVNEAKANICITDEAADAENGTAPVVDSFVYAVADNIKNISITAVELKEEYYKRFTWLLQYRYCYTALKSDLAVCKKEEVDYIFDLCYQLLKETPFLIEEIFKQGLIKNLPFYFTSHNLLLEQVLLFDKKTFRSFPSEALAKKMVNENNIENAYSEYDLLKHYDRAAFDKGILEIIRKNKVIDKHTDDIIHIITKDKLNFEQLKKMKNLSEEQLQKIFENVDDKDFEQMRSYFKEQPSFNYREAKLKPNQQNKLAFIREKVLADKQIPFNILLGYYNGDIKELKELVLEKSTEEIEFEKNQDREYIEIFQKEGKSKLLIAKAKEPNIKTIFGKRALQELEIKAAKDEYTIVAKRFKIYKLVIGLLLLLLLTVIGVSMLLLNENNQVKQDNYTLEEKSTKAMQKMDTLSQLYTMDTAFLKDSIRKMNVGK